MNELEQVLIAIETNKGSYADGLLTKEVYQKNGKRLRVKRRKLEREGSQPASDTTDSTTTKKPRKKRKKRKPVITVDVEAIEKEILVYMQGLSLKRLPGTSPELKKLDSRVIPFRAIVDNISCMEVPNTDTIMSVIIDVHLERHGTQLKRWSVSKQGEAGLLWLVIEKVLHEG